MTLTVSYLPRPATRIVRGASLAVFTLSLGLGAVMLPGPAQSAGPRLDIVATGLRSDTGQVLINVETESSWFRSGSPSVRALRLTPKGRSVRASIDGLSPGRYAVRIYHDENGDGRLNTGAFGLPTERYGFSGRSKRIGPPRFSEAAIEVSGSTTISIVMK